VRDVETAALLDRVADFIGRYVELRSSAQSVALALWVAHTYVVDAAFTTPYLTVLSPEKQSGKTRLLEVLEVLCARSWRVLAPSEAVLYRTLDAKRPTLLLDEVDGLFKSPAERTEPLRTLLNAGNRRGTAVPRCVGSQSELRDFEVFAPKVLAGIDNGTLPDTIRDRSIVVKMQRKRRRMDRFLPLEVEPVALEIREWLEGWADQVRPLLEDARPALPEELDDRAAEGWEALLAIADVAGEGWPGRAWQAAHELSAGVQEEEESRGVRLLRDTQAAFGDRRAMFTAHLLEFLNGDDEAPWGGWHRGEGLRPRDLSMLLRPYEIRPRTVRVEAETAKGYLREQFEDAWARYCGKPSQAEHPSHDSPHAERDVTEVADVTDFPDLNGRPATEKEEAEIERLRALVEEGA
jgi:hypothetical protein